MDTAVALVQAYLNVNGYFTVVEYPVLEAYRGGHARSVTDLDVLAFRFPHAGHEVILCVLALLEKWGDEAQPESKVSTGEAEGSRGPRPPTA